MPITGRRSGDPAAPAWIIAASRGKNKDAAAKSVTEDPESILLADGFGTRSIYALKQKGLTVAERNGGISLGGGLGSCLSASFFGVFRLRRFLPEAST